MIGVVGHMSGGKSYTAVSHILDDLMHGRRVCTNILLKCRAVTSYTNIPCLLWKQLVYILEETPAHSFHSVDVNDYESWPVGAPRGTKDYEQQKITFYIDEASSLFDSITSVKDKRIQDLSVWARHSEKRGQMLVLLMQFQGELNKRLRDHITKYIFCINSNSIRIPFIGMGVPFFLRNCIVHRETLADAKTLVGSLHWQKLDSRIYSCYNTAQIVVGEQFKPTVAYDSSELEKIKKLNSLGANLLRLCCFDFFVFLILFWRLFHESRA